MPRCRSAESHGLPGQTEKASARPAVLEHVGDALPGNGRRNHDSEATDLRGRADADEAAGGIDDGAAGESLVQRRGDANDLFEFSSAAGTQRAADHGDDAGARRQRVTPRTGGCERDVADPRR